MKFIQEKKFALTASFMVLVMLGVFLFPVKLNAANEPIKVAIVGNSMSEFLEMIAVCQWQFIKLLYGKVS